MRAVGETLKASGYYGLALRMPGHGTVPGGLTTAVWEDWIAAVRLGVRHVRARVGAGKPLLIVGYSNGGALAVKYALDAVERGEGQPAHAPGADLADDRRPALRVAGPGRSACSARSRTSRRPAGST